jgi:hypothetical protein
MEVITSHALMRFVHIVLFAYWLGADLGVYLGAKHMAKPGLDWHERMRMRRLVLAIDLGPRVALILMLPVGFQLAQAWGAPIPAAWMPVVWVVGFAWLALMLSVHFRAGSDLGETLRKIDLSVRYIVMVSMLGAGIVAYSGAIGPLPGWLSFKLGLFGLIIGNGLLLRRVAGGWTRAAECYAKDDIDGGEAIIQDTRSSGARLALMIWTLVAIMAFVGTVKPV